MTPRDSSANEPTGLLLGLSYREWFRKANKSGIRAVIDHYGVPNSYYSRDTKDVLMRNAWNVLHSTTPAPPRADVEAMIMLLQTPRSSGIPQGGQIPPSTETTPSNKITQSKEPSPLSSAKYSTQSPLSSSAGSNASRPGVFTANKPRLNPELDGGIQLTSSPFADKLASLLQRHFHRAPEPSVAPSVEAEPAPDYKVDEACRDLSIQELRTTYDDLHDPNITSVKLQVNDNFPAHDYRPYRHGREYAFRGRGPLWQKNSCAFDCVIVAARLLGIGRIQADTGSVPRDEWVQPGFHRQCLETFHAPWEILKEASNITQRDTFAKLVESAAESVKPLGYLQEVEPIWTACTAMANQFSWHQFLGSFCTSCKNEVSLNPAPPSGGVAPVGSTHRMVVLMGDSEGTMQQRLEKVFAIPKPDFDHMSCTGPAGGKNSVARRLRVVSPDGLPVRLVVKVPAIKNTPRHIPGSTNDNITFTYWTYNGDLLPDVILKPRTVTYRWLGGIYQKDIHFRVYWQDSDYATSSGNVKIYDGRQAYAAIIGEFPPSAPESKVPSEWSAGTDLLFYERINEDNRDQIMKEADIIVRKTTGHVSDKDVLDMLFNAGETPGQSFLETPNTGPPTTAAPVTLVANTPNDSTPIGGTATDGPSTVGTLIGDIAETQIAGTKRGLDLDTDDENQQPAPIKQKITDSN